MRNDMAGNSRSTARERSPFAISSNPNDPKPVSHRSIPTVSNASEISGCPSNQKSSTRKAAPVRKSARFLWSLPHRCDFRRSVPSLRQETPPNDRTFRRMNAGDDATEISPPHVDVSLPAGKDIMNAGTGEPDSFDPTADMSKRPEPIPRVGRSETKRTTLGSDS